MPYRACHHGWLAPALVFVLVARAVAAAPDGADDIFADGFDRLPVTVEQVQLGTATGTVLLEGRVVTARSADSRSFWIADSPTAAPFQGVFVFRAAGGAPLPPEVSVGGLVDVLGSTAEFDSSPPGDTLTEIVASNFVFVSAGGAPIPIDFASVATVGSIAAGEPYEGVLVGVQNVRVTAVNPGTRVTLTDNGGAQLVMTNGAAGVPVAPAVGTCYARVTGVMSVNVVNDERILLPRAPSDFVSGSACN